MSNLVIMKDYKAVTTSVKVAEDFGKDHKHVMRDIRDLEKDVPNFGLMFFEGLEPDYYNRDRKVYYMNRKGFVLLATGYNGKKALKFKSDYIDAFDQMEEHIKNNQIQIQIPKDPILALRLMLQATEETKEEVEDVKNRVVNLEENVSIDPGKYSYIGKCISQKVRQVGKERQWSMNKEQTNLLYKDINKAVAEVCGVRTRSQLREKHFDDVMDLIDDLEPSTVTRMLIHNLEDEEAFPLAEEDKR